jgi:hypothetical protein
MAAPLITMAAPLITMAAPLITMAAPLITMAAPEIINSKKITIINKIAFYFSKCFKNWRFL